KVIPGSMIRSWRRGRHRATIEARALIRFQPKEEPIMQTVAPEQVGVAPDRLTYLDCALQRYIDTGKLAGVTVVLSRRGQIFHAKGYGFANLATGQPIQPDT